MTTTTIASPFVFDQRRRGFVASGYVSPAEIDEFLTLRTDPSTRYLPPLMVTAWGRRPV
jgi:hypothetical protein